MRFEPALEEGVLIKRYKRFMADLSLPSGDELTVHCPNTGSMKNCNLPDARVLYSDSGNEKRKYRHTLEAVTTPSGAWAGVNTGRANHLVREAIEAGLIDTLQGYETIRPEVPYGEEQDGKKKSRIDFLLEGHAQHADCYVEVKNVTLEVDTKLITFPDAVTERGTKHLNDLIKVVEQGFRAVMLYCVQHSTAERFQPAQDIDPVYTETLQKAVKLGVEVLAYGAEISAEEIVLSRKVEVNLAPQ